MRHKTRSLIFLTMVLFAAPRAIGGDEPKSIPLFQVDVDFVVVKVSVTDSSNRFVTGLKKRNFRVYEDGIEQVVSHFSHEPAPISMGLIMDVSSSMVHRIKMGLAKDWFSKILGWENILPEDEYFLIVFNDRTRLVRSFSNKITALTSDIFEQQAGGDTALIDAVYWAMDICGNEGRNDRKALLLITDGDDNKSRYRRSEVLKYAAESEVQIYVLPVDSFGRSFLEELVRLTGGRYFGRTYSRDIDEYIDRIHKELRYQYILGYLPTDRTRDGRWRDIKVELDTPEGFPKLYINTRSGYYAPVH